MSRNVTIQPRRRSRHGWSRLSRDGGFSLVEVMMASLLLVVVLGAAYGIWFGLQRTYGYTEEDMQAQSEARSAMNEMVELIRTAKEPDFEVDESLDLVIVSAEPNALICWTDVDRDDAHDLELVQFRVDTYERSLYRDTSQSGDINFAAASTSTRLVGTWVANDYEEGNGLFTYLDMNGNDLLEGVAGSPAYVPDTTKIRQVKIDLFVDVVLGDRPEHHVLSSVVQPRNLRLY